MKDDLASLLRIIALQHDFAGVHFNLVPKQADYPAIGFYEIDDQAERSKDVNLNGDAVYEICTFVKEGDIETDRGPADIAYDVSEAIKVALNGFLGDEESKIVEIRWHSSGMEYNEQTELHVRRSDYLIQHK